MAARATRQARARVVSASLCRIARRTLVGRNEYTITANCIGACVRAGVRAHNFASSRMRTTCAPASLKNGRMNEMRRKRWRAERREGACVVFAARALACFIKPTYACRSRRCRRCQCRSSHRIRRRRRRHRFAKAKATFHRGACMFFVLLYAPSISACVCRISILDDIMCKV